MPKSAPYSSRAQEEEVPHKPLLSVLHLWRVAPSKESLRNIIRPSKGQLPIIMRAVRMSRRKFVMGIWVVSGGEAITISVYDPKAVQSVEITFVCGWWAELGIPPLKSMAISGLCGVAVYLAQGITLQIPEPDRKGRVDMSKAWLQFNPGPPPPLFEFGPSQFDPSIIGEIKVGGEARKGRKAENRVVWRGMRTFRQRAVLLACARNGPSMMIVRGWDSSMAWRMTNVVTFHEEDWSTWKEVKEPAKGLTTPYFSADAPPGTQGALSPSSHSPATAAAEEGQYRIKQCDDIRQPCDTSTSTTAAPEVESPPTVGTDQNGSPSGVGTRAVCPGSAGTNAAAEKQPAKGRPSLRNQLVSAPPATDQANNDRLCQAIADRVEVRFEGRGGRLALRGPRRRAEGNGGAGASGGHRTVGGGVGGGRENAAEGDEDEDEDGDDDGGDGTGNSDAGLYGGGGNVGGGRGLGSDELGSQEKGKDAPIAREFLSHKAMEERVNNLDMEEELSALAGGLGGPRRPREDAGSEMDESLAELPAATVVKCLARRRGADGKMRTVEEIVEQLAINKRKEEALAAAKRQEAVRKWKNLGKVLCRLLRMSDYWYGFASDGALLSNEERAKRRICVLQQIVEMRGGGRTTMKSLVTAIAERYPRSVWSRFRQLMRLPKAQRQRRDMAVCAILLGEIDNHFFKYTTAGWPFSRLVDLASDIRLVKKPTLSVLYEEGETTPGIFESELSEAGAPDNRTEGMVKISGMATMGAAGRSGGGRGEEQGTQPSPKKQKQQPQQEERWAVGAYVIIRGSVDLYVLERGPAAEMPTAACQEDLAAKASRGQPMCRTRPPVAWEAAGGQAQAMGDRCRLGTGVVGRRRQPAVTDSFEAVLSGSGSGPRRARTRNLAPRWKACRLGAGALFGDRPLGRESTATGPNADRREALGTDSKKKTPAAEWSSGSALETAITAEETELLEIGVSSYRRYLAKDVTNRTHRAVAVLKATKALDGVPASALARICRYATERTAGQIPVDAAHPPLLNPTQGAMSARDISQLAFSCDSEREASDDSDSSDRSGDCSSDCNNNSSDNGKGCSNTMCRRGTFRGTVFFVAEGHGKVVLDDLDESVGLARCPGGDGGGSSTESLLAATAFGNRRNRKAEKNRRRCGDEERGGSSGDRPCDSHGTSTGRPQGGLPTTVGSGPAAGTVAPSVPESEQKETKLAGEGQKGIAAAGSNPMGSFLDDRREQPQGQPSHAPSLSAATLSVSFADAETEFWGSAGGGEEGRCPKLAALTRGDFFGVDPASPTALASSERIPLPRSKFTFGSCSNTDDDNIAASSSPNIAQLAAVATPSPREDDPAVRIRAGNLCCRRPGLVAATNPAAIAAEPSAIPPPTFPGLHMASLVAGPGGMRCLAVGLAVLQKICPPVYRRLERAASERYSGWMTEATRRKEHEWHESFDKRLVRSLSRSFYDSYTKGPCSGSVAGKGATDMESSVGWTIGDDDGWAGGFGGGSRSVVSFDISSDGPHSCGNEATVQTAAAPASIVRSLHSISTSASESKSIFELSRRYVGLALCSSGRTVVPVRLGRAIVEATVPPRTSSAANLNGSLARPAPPPRAVTGNTRNARAARRVTSPHASADREMVPQVGHRHSFAPAAPTRGADGDGGGGGGADACAGWDGSPSKPAIENVRCSKRYKAPSAGATSQRSPSLARAGVDVTATSLENPNNSNQEAASVRVSCSRSRRCGASPARQRLVSSERMGGGEEIHTVLAQCDLIETYDCPVSPFSIPPSWADTPPLATMEPPGFPPPNKAPGDTTTAVNEAGIESGEGGPLGVGDLCMSPQVEGETRKTSVAPPAEKTMFQKIASGRRASFGWGWKRPPGERGRRRKRSGLSPRERALWSGTNLGFVYPPTS